MHKVRFITRVLALTIVALAVSPLAYAQATRTWVSGVGDDANPCSRTAPCKTFAGAISKTAGGGEISVLDPGGFGALTITKSITIDGGGGAGFASILSSGVNGIVINSAGIVVTLRNLSINGAGTTPGLDGIRILAASKVYIENCEIFGFGGADPAGRGITDHRTAAGGQLFVEHSVIRNNRSAAVEILPASGFTTTINATLDNVSLTGNGIGLAALTGAHATISRSVVSGNTDTGIKAEQAAGSNTVVIVDTCVVSKNGTGITSTLGAAQIALSNNVITQNATGVAAGTGFFATFGNNKVLGNTAGNGPLPAATSQQ